MWTTNLLALIFSYLSAYLRCFRWKCDDTRVEYGRFYLLNWAFTSYALYLFYWYTSFLQGREISYGCQPEQSLPFLAIFVIAEIASFVLLACSYIDLAFKREALSWRRVLSDFTTIGPRSNWRMYRLMWIWFPYTLLIVTYLSSGAVKDIVTDCVMARGPTGSIPYSLLLLWPLLWRGLSVASLVIIGANWIAFRWKPSRRLLAEFALVGISYILTFAIIGPPDIFGLLSFCRRAPDLFQWLYHSLPI
jgi:hypothetical protein